MRRQAAILCALATMGASSAAFSADVTVGAIPGSFDVSLSGSSSYSAPIKIAPGSAGTQPQLSLGYDSQAFGGVLGAGWSIGGLSAITRGPRDVFVDGLPSGINFDDKDALYLDGQRLVEVPATASSIPGATYYRKINDDHTEIVRYGASLERSYFRVRTKGGLTIVFGNPGNASTPSPDPVKYDASILIRRDVAGDNLKDHVLAFAESAAIDTAGNIIEFHYKQNGKGDYNVDQVLYTGHGSIDDKAVVTVERAPFASVSFTYQDAPRPLEVYLSGGLLKKEKILSDLHSCVSENAISYPFDCKSKTSSAVGGVYQVAHYHLDYNATDTAGRLVLSKLHMFGADDATEIPPTTFDYTPANAGWTSSPNLLPSALTLADLDHVARGYRFAHVDPGLAGGLDLLFATQINGKNVAFAFKNGGPSSWEPGGQPWTESGRTDLQGKASGFAPPVPFVDEDGSDLGVIVADIDGSGRAAIIQSDVRAKQWVQSAYLAGTKQYELHPEYNIPFVVSEDGKVASSYRFAKWSGGVGPDMIYTSGDKKGFLKNLGPGAKLGWEVQKDEFSPPISIDRETHLIDLDCSGGPPALVGPVKNADGTSAWKVFRYTPSGWVEETDPKWHPPFPADTDPEAVREVRFDSSSKCGGLIVASAKINLHLAVVPSKDGWKVLGNKVPTFNLVDTNGLPSKALVADLKGDGFDGIVANTLLPNGSSIRFAYTQDAAGWHDSPQFLPGAALNSLDPRKPVLSFVGPIIGKGGDDVAILNDQRVTSSTDEGRNRQFGVFYTNDGSGLTLQSSFAPPIQIATKDKTDTGVRFVDLHGTGLPDAVYSRLVTRNGKTYLESGAYRNTGHGWAPEGTGCTDSDEAFDTSKTTIPMKSGLCPPVPFAGADITGNPIQFVDLDADGFADLIYSYRDKSNNLVTKIYFNASDGTTGRKWVDAASDPVKLARYSLPVDVLPLAASGIGDMGVRFVKFDVHQLGVLKSFREGRAQCGRINPRPGCPAEGAWNRRAFTFDGNKWTDAGPGYLPPVPFVTQYSSPSDHAIDLFVQLMDVTGAGLPSIVAAYQDPITGNSKNSVWTNDGTKWIESGIKAPVELDAVYRAPKTLIQLIDVNGDGLPDVVMSKGDAPDQSKTWLGTGAGWVEASDWKIPADAISSKDGDPGFRLVDANGDGYIDVLWLRPDENGQARRGLGLNNGHDWKTRKDNVVPPGISFVDGDGVDQGVRLLSVTGKGVTDIVASFGGSQRVYLNQTRRADVLSSIVDGYGIKTKIAYQTLLEYDCSDSPSGHDCNLSPAGVQTNPLGWRAYEREAAASYPRVAPVPTTYVVRQSSVDEADGKAPVVLDYRYGKYLMDANASRSLGFGWRESLNEFSKILTRSELIQDARVRPGAAVETSCVVDIDQLRSMVTRALASSEPNDQFPKNLCASGNAVSSAWGRKISELDKCWNIVEGDAQGHINEFQLPEVASCARSGHATATLSGRVVRQAAIWKSEAASFELDGNIISRGTDTFTYDDTGGLFDRHGNVLSTRSELADGTSIQTDNAYEDNSAAWFLGRLTRSVVTKKGDVVPGGAGRKTETHCSRFEYYADTGLIKVQATNCGNAKAVKTELLRDRYGNIETSVVSAAGEPDQVTTTGFDRFGRYAVSQTDVFKHKSSVERDPRSGQPLLATDMNGLTTTFIYDGFGRLRRQIMPTGIENITELVSPSALPKAGTGRDIAGGLSTPVSYAIKSQVGTLPETWALFDAKGRQLRQVTSGFATNASIERLIFKEAEYDSLGRVMRSSVPHEATDANIRWMSNEYDALGRVCAATAINGLRSETLFVGRPEGGGTVIVEVDPRTQLSDSDRQLLSCGKAFPSNIYNSKGLRRRTSSTINMRKQTILSVDAKGRVSLEYDAGGRVDKITGPTGAVTVNTYDELGNKIAVSDPDLGLWSYQHDPFGHVVWQTDAKGQITTMEYDLAGRPFRRAAQDVVTTWHYDRAKHGVGKISSVESSNGYRAEYFYDDFGRMNGTAVSIDQEQFFSTSEFDPYGRAIRVSYPNGFAVRNVYDNKGFFVKVTDAATSKTYWDAKAIDVLGRVTEETLGNGVTTVREYRRSDERLSKVSARGANGRRVMDLALDFDLIGNLTERDEAVEQKKETFDYDGLNRLIAVVSADNGKSSYTYDAAGRFKFKAGLGDYQYAKYPGTIQKDGFHPFHGVEETGEGRNSHAYRYDLNGNMISMPQGHLDYTSDNRVKLIYLQEAKWSRFDYGPSGDRFRQFARKGAVSQETLYVGLFERITDYSLSRNADYLRPSKFSGFGGITRSRNYISNGSGVFAVVETDETYANTELFEPRDPKSRWFGKRMKAETWYMHADQLGSILRVTDQDGRIRERFWYDPWGATTRHENNRPGKGESERIAGTWTRGFTGHEQLDEFALVHMNGRVYSSALGLFTSVDPINQMVTDTQSGNGYLYTRANPLRYTDPTGYFSLGDIGKAFEGAAHAIGGAIGSAWEGIKHFGGEVGKWFSENWRIVVVVVVVIVIEVVTVGAATPALGAVGAGILGGMAAGAAGGALGAALYGGSTDDIIGAAIKGAVIGAFAGAASAEANAYFGAVGTQTTTASEVGSIATHGAISGVRQAAEGGNFWTGFEAGLIATAVSTYGPQEMGHTGNVVKSSLIGGTTSAINGEKFANGAILGAFSADFRTWVEGGSSLVGKIWALPNTVFGLAVGLVEYGAGLLEGTHPEWKLGENSLQLLNAPWGTGGAITFGNVEIFNNADPKDRVPVYGNSGNTVVIERHEEGHTYQYERLGPLFAPAYFMFGGFKETNPLEKSADRYGRGEGGAFSGFR
ncbi:RHS repeat-associated core domain-containing protein [Bradyrhizobium elkanii]